LKRLKFVKLVGVSTKPKPEKCEAPSYGSKGGADAKQTGGKESEKREDFCTSKNSPIPVKRGSQVRRAPKLISHWEKERGPVEKPRKQRGGRTGVKGRHHQKEINEKNRVPTGILRDREDNRG